MTINGLLVCNGCDARDMARGQDHPDSPGYCLECLLGLETFEIEPVGANFQVTIIEAGEAPAGRKHFGDTFENVELAKSWALDVLVVYFNVPAFDARRYVAEKMENVA